MFNAKQLIALAIWWVFMGLALYGALESMTIDPARIVFWLYLAIWPVMIIFSMLKAIVIIVGVAISVVIIFAIIGAMERPARKGPPQTFHPPRHMPD